MRLVYLPRILTITFCLLALSALALVGCDNGEDVITTASVISTISSTTSMTETTATSIEPSPVDAPVEVPDVIGMEWSDAETELEGRSLVSERYDVPDLEWSGSVVEQDPSGGTLVPAGTTVRLGVQRFAWELDDLVGMTREEVEIYCAELHLHLDITYVESSLSNLDKVLSQDPAAGTLVYEFDGEVAVTIGRITITLPPTTPPFSPPTLPFTLPTGSKP